MPTRPVKRDEPQILADLIRLAERKAPDGSLAFAVDNTADHSAEIIRFVRQRLCPMLRKIGIADEANALADLRSLSLIHGMLGQVYDAKPMPVRFKSATLHLRWSIDELNGPPQQNPAVKPLLQAADNELRLWEDAADAELIEQARAALHRYVVAQGKRDIAKGTGAWPAIITGAIIAAFFAGLLVGSFI